MKLNDKVRVAEQFADMLFRDQGKMYGNMPYSKHLWDVHNVLLRFDVTDRNLLAAAFLHDILEDTEVSYDMLAELFGDDVADLVRCVTDEPGANRKERHEKTYPKIAADVQALQLKLADRIANLENSIATSEQRMFRMYRKEQPDFSKALRTLGVHDDMWNHLERLFNQGTVKFDQPNLGGL